MLTIDIHTHIMPENMPDFKEKFGYGGFIQLQHKSPCCAHMVSDSGAFFREVEKNCWDSATRLQECDGHQVDVQVLSTIPVLFSYWAKAQDGLTVAQFLNDHLAEVVSTSPKRFIGLGTVPLQDTDLAIQELKRCVEELKFPGLQIGTHVGDKNLNHPDLFPFFEAVADLNACLFIHPWDMMGKADMPDYWLPWLVGMPAETSRAICSMIFGGVFERLPNLRCAFAHGGGSFPATIGRIEHGFNVRPDLCAIDNKVNPRDYLDRMYFDSLVHDEATLSFMIETIGADRIALGSDYPFPLGELHPGKMINSIEFLHDDCVKRLLSGTALEWLGHSEEQYL